MRHLITLEIDSRKHQSNSVGKLERFRRNLFEATIVTRSYRNVIQLSVRYIQLTFNAYYRVLSAITNLLDVLVLGILFDTVLMISNRVIPRHASETTV